MDNKFEKRLKTSLQERWPETDQDPTALIRLEIRMQDNGSRKTVTRNPLRIPARVLVGLAILASLAIGLNLALDSLPAGPAAAEETAEVIDVQPTPAPATPTQADTIDATATPIAFETPADSVALFPQVTWELPGVLPDSPGSFVLYRQSFDRPADEAAALEWASRLGIDGALSSFPGEGGGMTYRITDETQTLILLAFASQFSYFSDAPQLIGDPLPFSDRVRASEDFLNALGLLTFPYRVEQDPGDPHAVRFVQLLDGAPLIYGLGMNPILLEWITTWVNPFGEVTALFHSLHDFQPVASLDILTAAEAWERFSGSTGYAQYAILAAPLVMTQESVDSNGQWPSYGLGWSCTWAGGGGGSLPDANYGGGRFSEIVVEGGPSVTPTQAPIVSSVQPVQMIADVQGRPNSVFHIYPAGLQPLEINVWVDGSGVSDSSGLQTHAAALNGNVVINTVELAYAAMSLENCTHDFLTNPGIEQLLYVQPVWRFVGSFEDGRTIEIVVQALASEHLK